MRTLEIKLYKFEELNEQAQEQAIKLMRDTAAESGTEADWDDANDSLRTVQEIAGIRCDIQFSSQGHYYRSAHLRYESYPTDEEELEMWEGFVENMKNYKIGVWSDELIQKAVLEHEYNNMWSYAGNVATALVEFCNKVYFQTCDYYDDDYTKQFIIANDIEFYENGNPYK